MKKNQMIKLLSNLPDDTEIIFYNNQYAGGIDIDSENEPILLLNSGFSVVLCDEQLLPAAEMYYGELLPVEEAIKDRE